MASSNIKCHNIQPPCHLEGEYIITYQNAGNGGFVVYGACEGHIAKMRLGYQDMIYIKDEKVNNG